MGISLSGRAYTYGRERFNCVSVSKQIGLLFLLLSRLMGERRL